MQDRKIAVVRSVLARSSQPAASPDRLLEADNGSSVRNICYPGHGVRIYSSAELNVYSRRNPISSGNLN